MRSIAKNAPIVRPLYVIYERWYVCVQVDGIFEKVGYDPAANSQVTRRAPTASAAEQDGTPVGGGLPRIDLSTLLEKVQCGCRW